MFFSLPLPPPTNHAYGTASNGRRSFMYKTKEAKDWQNLAGLLMKRIMFGPTLYEEPVYLRVDMHLKFNRDYDSSLKLLSDTLEDVGVVANDKWIYHATINKIMKSDNPRLEIYVGTKPE